MVARRPNADSAGRPGARPTPGSRSILKGWGGSRPSWLSQRTACHCGALAHDAADNANSGRTAATPAIARWQDLDLFGLSARFIAHRSAPRWRRRFALGSVRRDRERRRRPQCRGLRARAGAAGCRGAGGGPLPSSSGRSEGPAGSCHAPRRVRRERSTRRRRATASCPAAASRRRNDPRCADQRHHYDLWQQADHRTRSNPIQCAPLGWWRCHTTPRSHCCGR